MREFQHTRKIKLYVKYIASKEITLVRFDKLEALTTSKQDILPKCSQ